MTKFAPNQYKTQICPECGLEFTRSSGRGGVKNFCTDQHKRDYQARQMKQGRAIIALAKAWRESRNRKEDRAFGAEALSEMVSIIDSFVSQDREAGRPKTIGYAKRLLKQGRYIDRKGS